MKKSIPFVLLIALLLMICFIPSSEATVLDDNPAGTTIATVGESDSMVNNYGTITNNYGTITNNYGTIVNNYGTVTNNQGDGALIVNNNSTIVNNKSQANVANNYSDIENNNAHVMKCYGSSNIGTNGSYGMIMELTGHAEVETNNGLIVRMLGGIVETNGSSGRIYLVTNSTPNVSGGDPGEITTNNGTIITMNDGTVGTNSGMIKRIANGSDITSGTGANNDFRGESSQWVGDTSITPSVTSGPGWEFNRSTNTLRLENANITTKQSRANGFMNYDFTDLETEDAFSSAAIYDTSGRTLNIVLIGDNTISTNSAGFAIYSESNINIAGTGSLTINNSNAGGYGIYAAGTIWVTSGTVTSSGHTEGIKLMYGDLNINGGTVTASATYMGGMDLETQSGSVSITEGSLTANNSNINGNLSISDGTLGTKLFYCNGNGFNPGTATVSGGIVNINNTGELGTSLFSMSGGKVNIGNSGYISAGQFSMSAGTITIRNGGSIYVSGDVTIEGGSITFQGDLPEYLAGITAMDALNEDASFTMTGGRIAVTSASPTADRILIQADNSPGGSLSYGAATLTNLTRTGNTLTLTQSGPASVGFPLPTFTVSFNANGGSGTMDPVENVSEYTLPENGFTAPDGKVFKCWSVDDVEMDPGETIAVEADTVVYAEWETPEWIGYSVSFSHGEGTGTMDTVYASGNYEVPNPTFTPPQGKVFWGWISNEGTGYNFKPGDHIPLSSSISFLALWIVPDTYAVTIDTDHAWPYIKNYLSLTGEYTLPASSDIIIYPPTSDKVFKCWKIGDTNYNPGDKITLTKDVVVNTVWSTKYTVTFDGNGGTPDVPLDYTDGNGKLASLPNAIYSEHWMLGWYTAASGGTEVTTDTVFTENTTVYAHWGPVTVTFDANGGTCATASAQTNQQNKLASLPTATRDSYRFNGWFTTATTGDKIDANTVFKANTTVYAHWTQVYTVTYQANGGTGADVVVPNILGDYVLAANTFTAPSDKAFKCWLIGEKEMYPNDKINVTANITVKAVWKGAPAPEPTPTHDGDNYSNTITAGTDTNVTSTFTDAKASNGTVNVKVGDMDIKFDKDAVSAIGGNTVSLKAEVKTENTGVEGAEAVVEVTLDGASFSSGKATLTVPFTQGVPSGKLLKVYFINGSEKTEMPGATYQDDKVVFETTHFSTYAIMFVDDPDASSSSGGGFPWWIIGVIVAVVAVAGVAVFIYMKKH